ncbi:Uracil-DNA glycosylase, family 1 [hydrothermal vent metagenome]|uniref:Uracil-DNA glycosylase, family 1 n=1 Tax=hydrothermal vent metagenome TaxID=652676 RepID=A0A1W1BA59_9ZZZZ
MIVDESWSNTITTAYRSLSPSYRHYLESDRDYFPSQENYLNAFKTLPRDRVKYILFGQDPYPRRESAIGYSFIDGKVSDIFSDRGLSRDVNRATSLRNFIKMALVARGDLDIYDTTQSAISRIDKSHLISSIYQLKDNFEANGVLLLNTALIFSSKEKSRYHIKEWRPFVETLLKEMLDISPKLILFGTHAKALKRLKYIDNYETIEMEHPYNHTFISNPKALELFGDMDLLSLRLEI